MVYLFSRGHAGRQEGYDWEHVLQRVQHGHEGHDTHRQRVVVPRLQDHLQKGRNTSWSSMATLNSDSSDVVNLFFISWLPNAK